MKTEKESSWQVRRKFLNSISEEELLANVLKSQITGSWCRDEGTEKRGSSENGCCIQWEEQGEQL